jgi:hypothetical protein
MVEFFLKLQKTDFVIYEAFLLIVFCCWYWICFMDGAQIWADGIRKFWGPRWYWYQSLARPVLLKIFATIFLFAAIGGGYGIILNKISNF